MARTAGAPKAEPDVLCVRADAIYHKLFPPLPHRALPLQLIDLPVWRLLLLLQETKAYPKIHVSDLQQSVLKLLAQPISRFWPP